MNQLVDQVKLKPPDNYMRVAHLMPENTSTMQVILATLACYDLNTAPNFYQQLDLQTAADLNKSMEEE